MKHKRNFFWIIFLLLILGGGGWYAYQKFQPKKEEIRYVTAPASRGSLVVNVSGSGYVAATSRVDVKPKVSGDLITLFAKSGTAIAEGAVIGEIDNEAAKKELRDAHIKLQNARLSLKKIKEPPTALELLQAKDAINAAKRELDTLKEPADDTDILNAENALSKAKSDYDSLLATQELARLKAQDTKVKAQEVLDKSRDDAFTAVAGVFLDLPSIKAGIESIMTASPTTGGQAYIDSYSDQVSPQTETERALALKNEMRKSLASMNGAYAPTLSYFNETTRYDSSERIESLLNKTLETAKAMSETLKRMRNYLDFVETNFTDRKVTVPTNLRTNQTTVQGYIEDMNTHIGQILSSIRTLKDNSLSLENAKRDLAEMDTDYPRAKETALRTIREKEAALQKLQKGPDAKDIQAAEEKIKEKEAALADLKKGPNELDIESQELSIHQSEIAVSDAKEKLDDYTARAPITGIVAQVPVKRGDSVSASTVIASIVTKKKVAEISLNEIDAARVSIGMRATLTFDALPSLSLTGEVVEMDIIGTLEQGVVTYTVKIAFDTENPSVREGMSVTATILVDSRIDTLIIPSSSVNSEDGQDSVQILSNGVPIRRPVKKGISNDTQIEILEGLQENDAVITQTIRGDQGKANNQNQPQSLFPTGGGMRQPGSFGGGGTFRR